MKAKQPSCQGLEAVRMGARKGRIGSLPGWMFRKEPQMGLGVSLPPRTQQPPGAMAIGPLKEANPSEMRCKILNQNRKYANSLINNFPYSFHGDMIAF